MLWERWFQKIKSVVYEILLNELSTQLGTRPMSLITALKGFSTWSPHLKSVFFPAVYVQYIFFL